MNTMYDIVDNIVKVVYYKYFNYIKSQDLKEDLMQEGYMKAYELLNNGNYDPNMPLRNFLYTGVRNAMTNYLYHTNKENHVDLEELDKYENIVGVYDVSEPDIEIDIIDSVVDRFKQYGDIKSNVINYLNYLNITNIPVIVDTRIPEQFNKAIITLVLWQLCEREREKE